MPVPTLTGTETNSASFTTSTGLSVSRSHSSGRVVVIYAGEYSGSTVVLTLTNPGAVAFTAIASRNGNGTVGTIRVWLSDAAVAASTVTAKVTMSGGPSPQRGSIFIMSLTDYLGTMTTVVSESTTATVAGNRTLTATGTATTTNDLAIGVWLIDDSGTTVGTLTAAGNSTQHVGGSLSNSTTSHRAIVVKETATAGSTVLDVSHASWAYIVNVTGLVFAFSGVADVPPGNPPVLAAATKGYSGELSAVASSGFNYVHTGGFVLVALHVGEGSSGTGCTVNGVNCGALVATHFIAPASVINIWASATELSAGTYNVTVAGASGRGEICVNSITNWNRTVTAVTKSSGTNITTSMTVSGITGDDLAVGWWGFALSPWTSVTFNQGSDQTSANDASAGDGSSWASFQAVSRKNTRAAPSATLTATSSYGLGAWISMVIAFRGGTYTPPTPTNVSVGGDMSFTGGMERSFNVSRDMSGALSFSGAISRNLIGVRILTGVVTFNGSVNRGITRLLSGLLSFNGVVSTFQPIKKSLSGNLSFNGAINAEQATGQHVGGDLTFNGGVIRKMQKGLFGILSFVGDVVLSGSAIPGSGGDDLYPWLRRKRHRG